MQFYTLNMFMHVYNKRGRDFLHEQFYFKFYTDFISYGDFYIGEYQCIVYNVLFCFLYKPQARPKQKFSMVEMLNLQLDHKR